MIYALLNPNSDTDLIKTYQISIWNNTENLGGVVSPLWIWLSCKI